MEGLPRSPSIQNALDLAATRELDVLDPAAGGAECCARGTIALRMHGRVVKKARIENPRPFEADLRTPGWYTIDLSATRRPPHHGCQCARERDRVQAGKAGLTQ